MTTYETYWATADAETALELGCTESPFCIEVRFLGGLTQGQMDAFKCAADRWVKVIVGDLPSVMVDGEEIDDVLILAQGTDIDGPGRILGQAGPTYIRPQVAGDQAYLPAKGVMTFDVADLAQMELDGTLEDVITHEMGHVIGIGKTIWSLKNLLNGAGSVNPTFVGAAAMAEYGLLREEGGDSTPIPVANTGGPGTRDSHWRESIFLNELMSGFIAGPDNPISRMTVASLQDMGYVVDLDAAEPYQLPDLFALAESGVLVAHEAPFDLGVMLPNLPIELPPDSLIINEESRANST